MANTKALIKHINAETEILQANKPAISLVDLILTSLQPGAGQGVGPGATLDSAGHLFIAQTPLGLMNFTPVSDAAYAALATDFDIGYLTLTASRIVTLPTSTGIRAGHFWRIIDVGGNVLPTRTITITTSGTDKLNGVTNGTIILRIPNASITITHDGAGNFYVLGNGYTPRVRITYDVASSADGAAASNAANFVAVRTLSNIDLDEVGGVTLVSNQITFPVGIWRLNSAWFAFHSVTQGIVMFYNATTSTPVCIGGLMAGTEIICPVGSAKFVSNGTDKYQFNYTVNGGGGNQGSGHSTFYGGTTTFRLSSADFEKIG